MKQQWLQPGAGSSGAQKWNEGLSLRAEWRGTQREGRRLWMWDFRRGAGHRAGRRKKKEGKGGWKKMTGHSARRREEGLIEWVRRQMRRAKELATEWESEAKWGDKECVQQIKTVGAQAFLHVCVPCLLYVCVHRPQLCLAVTALFPECFAPKERWV